MTDQEDNMSALSEQEMTTLLGLISKASNEQIRIASSALRTASDARSRQATIGLRVGQRVKWNGKHGPGIGTVKKIKQKYVEVLADGGKNLTWNVPASMLTVVP